jgi:hypothetical protein
MALIPSLVWSFALVSIVLVAICSLSGITLFLCCSFYFSIWERELFLTQSDNVFSALQIAMIPWIQMETLQLLSTFTNGQLMVIWLVLNTMFLLRNLISILLFFTLTTVHYCILNILKRHMCMFQNIYRD